MQWAKVGIFVRKSQLADLSRHEEFGEAIFTLRDIYRVPVRRIARKMIKGGEVNICMGAPPLLLIQHSRAWSGAHVALPRAVPFREFSCLRLTAAVHRHAPAPLRKTAMPPTKTPDPL